MIFWVGWRGVPLLLQVSKSGLRPSEKPFDKSGIRHTLMWDRLGGMATQTYLPDLPDLTDAEWELLQSLLPDAVSRRGRPRRHSLCTILDAIFYVLRCLAVKR